MPSTVHFLLFTVQYANITALLVEGIKEQQKIIDNLQTDNFQSKSEIDDLNKKISSLNRRLAKMEVLLNKVLENTSELFQEEEII